jgi:hypothetical protein
MEKVYAANNSSDDSSSLLEEETVLVDTQAVSNLRDPNKDTLHSILYLSEE